MNYSPSPLLKGRGIKGEGLRMPIQRDTITPDSIRNKELEDLRRKLRRANLITWLLFVAGLIIGAVITWALT